MELTYKPVDAENLPLALEIQRRIWPNSAVDADYLAKPAHPDDASNVSWLVYRGADLVGLTGIFTFGADEPGFDDNESVWMDWFAILPEFRGRHLGQQVLLDTIAYCRKLSRHQYFRIDTKYYPGRPAVALYDEVMPLCEEYTAEDTPEHKNNYLIYSCSLGDAPVKPWNNRPLNLGASAEKDVII